MKFKKSLRRGMGIGMVTLLLAACAGQKEPARVALVGVQDAFRAAGAEPQKYIPEQYAAVQTKVVELQNSYQKQDFAAVLAGAPAVLAEAQALPAAAVAGKQVFMDGLAAEWTTLSAEMPKLLDTVQKRVAAATKGARLPEGANLQAAQLNATNASIMWTQAQAAGASGQVESAVATAKKAHQRLESAAAALKMDLTKA